LWGNAGIPLYYALCEGSGGESLASEAAVTQNVVTG
jgi:hypothetical protein